MAKTTHETAQSSPTLDWDDSWILTMRIGGYQGAMPFRQYPGMTPSDQRAFLVGCRYLAERAGQAALVRAEKERKPIEVRPGEFVPYSPDRFLQNFMAGWNAPTDGADFETVGSLRADLGRQYIREVFKVRDFPENDRSEEAARARATVEKNLPVVLAHPRHGAEVARRLAAKMAEYIAPKKRDGSYPPVSPLAEGEVLDLEAA
jgi:hypothetical protein